MGKIIKLLIILAAITGLFMYYPNIAGYEADPQPAQQAETTQMQEQANPVSEYQQTESTLKASEQDLSSGGYRLP